MNIQNNSKKSLHKYDLAGELEHNITTLDELENYISLEKKEKNSLFKIIKTHPMSITRYYLSLIDPNDPTDPIRKMVVPSVDELSRIGSFDTSGEKINTKAIGLQHKYMQTALILTTNKCPSYCRFCFRKRLVGFSDKEIISNFNVAQKYISEHTEINNVLLTGGDPFSLENHIIEHFLESFATIDHLDFVRFGSRIPVVLPQRISEDKELQDIFLKYSTPGMRIHVVTHFNHPNEVTKEARVAIDVLLKCGVPVHNQTVLMKGVNDSPEVIAKLQNMLVSAGVNPYYIFQCRPVKKVTHFQVTLAHGLDILNEANKQMNGLSKRFKYIMSHKTGKIEIISKDDEFIYFKYHQAKDPKNIGKFFKLPIISSAKWLDDLKW
ncbi:MAG: KamA family radical SAM protein [Candidatus Methanofastidiosia archaeon]